MTFVPFIFNVLLEKIIKYVRDDVWSIRQNITQQTLFICLTAILIIEMYDSYIIWRKESSGERRPFDTLSELYREVSIVMYISRLLRSCAKLRKKTRFIFYVSNYLKMLHQICKSYKDTFYSTLWGKITLGRNARKIREL